MRVTAVAKARERQRGIEGKGEVCLGGGHLSVRDISGSSTPPLSVWGSQAAPPPIPANAEPLLVVTGSKHLRHGGRSERCIAANFGGEVLDWGCVEAACDSEHACTIHMIGDVSA